VRDALAQRTRHPTEDEVYSLVTSVRGLAAAAIATASTRQDTVVDMVKFGKGAWGMMRGAGVRLGARAMGAVVRRRGLRAVSAVHGEVVKAQESGAWRTSNEVKEALVQLIQVVAEMGGCTAQVHPELASLADVDAGIVLCLHAGGAATATDRVYQYGERGAAVSPAIGEGAMAGLRGACARVRRAPRRRALSAGAAVSVLAGYEAEGGRPAQDQPGYGDGERRTDARCGRCERDRGGRPVRS
jgi:hypothetical protein